MDTAEELGRNPVSKHQIQPRLTRDGTAEPVSRDQILRRERGQRNITFPCLADHEQDWQPYPVIVVVVFFTLTDRASTIPSNILRGANPVRGHKVVPRSKGHIMVTTRYSDQQGSKSRQKVMGLYKRWHRPVAKRFIKPPSLNSIPLLNV